jgi:hypothetical protein
MPQEIPEFRIRIDSDAMSILNAGSLAHRLAPPTLFVLVITSLPGCNSLQSQDTHSSTDFDQQPEVILTGTTITADYATASEITSEPLLYPAHGLRYTARPRGIGTRRHEPDTAATSSGFDQIERTIKVIRDSEIASGSTLLGFLQTRRHIVVLTAAANGPLYSVYTHNADPVALQLTQEQVARLEPDLGPQENVIATPGAARPLIWAISLD